MTDVREIVRSFSSQLYQLLGDKLSKVILYGSYARGDFHNNSDVDIMILVRMSEDEIRSVRYQIYDMAFDILMDTGVDISPIIKNEDQYMYWIEDLPFYRNIAKEGVIIN